MGYLDINGRITLKSVFKEKRVKNMASIYVVAVSKKCWAVVNVAV